MATRKSEAEQKATRCALCGGPQDSGMRERLANGDAELCEPCYRFEEFGEIDGEDFDEEEG